MKESIENAIADGYVHLTQSILRELMNRGTNSEGLIRIPGNSRVINQMKEDLDQGNPVDWKAADPFDLAGLLKLYIVELPDSPVPPEVYEQLKDIGKVTPTAIT